YIENRHAPGPVAPVTDTAAISALVGKPLVLIGDGDKPLPVGDQRERAVRAQIGPVEGKLEFEAVSKTPARARRLVVRVREVPPFPADQVANHHPALRQLLVEQQTLLPR